MSSSSSNIAVLLQVLHKPPASSSSHHHLHLVRCPCSHSAALSPTSTSTHTTHSSNYQDDDDAALLALLRQGNTDAAYRLFASNPSLPESLVSASRLLAQLSYSSKPPNSSLHLLDANSLSLAAYVGFGDIPTAERIVQAMRDRRVDICLLLRQVAAAEGDQFISDDDEHQQKMQSSAVLDDIVIKPSSEEEEIPLLPKAYPPNSRVYTTLIKGYMNAGRVDDVVAMLRDMRREGETSPASRPDHGELDAGGDRGHGPCARRRRSSSGSASPTPTTPPTGSDSNKTTTASAS